MKKNTHNYNRSLPWIMWGFSSLFYCYQFIIRVCPSVMADEWMLAFSIDAASLGIMVAFYYYAYAGMQIPLGIMIDKLGPRLLLSMAGVVCALGCLIVALTHNLWLACLGRFLMGMGAACGFLGTMKIATLWFPPRKLALIAGLTTALGTVGGIAGLAPLSILNSAIRWESSLYLLAILGAAISLFIWIFVKDSPEGKTIALPHEKVPLLEGLKLIIANPQAWLIAFHGFLMYVPLAAFADLWGVPFLKSAYHFDEEYAATMTSVIYIGVIVGGLALGKFSALFRTRRTPMLMGALLSCLCYAAVIFIHPLPDWALYCLLFSSGVFFTTECLCFVAVCEHLPIRYGGIAIGFTNMLIMFSGVFMQPLVGWMLRKNWDGKMDGNIPFYTLNDFQRALWVIPASLIAAALVLCLIKQSKAHKYD